MGSRIIFLLGKIIFIILLTLLSVQAFACRCAVPTLEKQLNKYKYVFVARIISLREVKSTKKYSAYVKVGFESKIKLKGKSNKIKYLKSGYGGGDCGVPFSIASTYIIFIDDSAGVTSCSGSRVIVMENNRHKKFIETIRLSIQSGKPVGIDFNYLN